MPEILKALMIAHVVHVDETSIKVQGKLTCVRTEETNGVTSLSLKGSHLDKELPAVLLELYSGVLVHDHDKKYYKNTLVQHAECNAHILRYVTYYIELHKHQGAIDFDALLKRINKERHIAITSESTCFTAEYVQEIRLLYRTHLSTWQAEYDAMVDHLSPKQVKKYHTNERLLIQRLVKYEDAHLLFIENFEVPFTNNEAERSFGSLKAIMHISGTFRSEKHVHYVMSIQSLLGTG
ncbi:MAG: IS66 family transposase [Culicoidibacterales bacterium]